MFALWQEEPLRAFLQVEPAVPTWWLSAGVGSHSRLLCSFFVYFFLNFLFTYDSHREREREAET